MKASRIKKGIKNRMTKTWTKTIHLHQTIKSIIERDKYVLAYWSCTPSTSTNWGDAINPVIISHYSKKKVLHIANVLNLFNLPVYSAIGSVLDKVQHNNLVVWGSGFMRSDSRLRIPPKDVLLVRGPLSRKLIINSGFNCPENYGDPGLLFSKLYWPEVKKQYKLGIIPHYVDFNSDTIQVLKRNKDVHIIDVMSGLYNVVDEALKCEFIASSSLHGLILADTYGIPNTWIKLSNKISGGSFKFHDYYLSKKYKHPGPVEKEGCLDIKKLIKKSAIYDVDLTNIIDSCPF